MQRSASSSSQHAAQEEELVCLPQSQPMQRSIELLPYPEADNTTSPSDEEISSTDMETTPSLPYDQSVSPHGCFEGLHSPLECNDKRLLGMPPLPHVSPRGAHEIGLAEMLVQSIKEEDLEDQHFTESYGIDDDARFNAYEYRSEEEYTVLAMWCIIKRAALPVDTFVLASLILEELDESFYHEWSIQMNALYRSPYVERTKELIIVAACVPYSFHCTLADEQIIAQKFLHDAIYTLSTWTTICCKPRPDINHRNLEMTERLILKHITWSVSRIADEQTIADQHEQIMDLNVSEIQRKYCQLYPEDLEDDDCSDSPPNDSSYSR